MLFLRKIDLIYFYRKCIRNYSNNLKYILMILVFFQAVNTSKVIRVFVFSDNNLENLIENFLISYFKYSHLAWSSLIFPLSKLFWVFAVWDFILSTKSEFKANELLNFHRPFPLPSSWFVLKVKINGERSEVKAVKMFEFAWKAKRFALTGFLHLFLLHDVSGISRNLEQKKIIHRPSKR